MSEEIQIPDKFKDIVEKVEKMTIMELAELVKVLEQKFGVSATPTFVGGAAPAAGAAAADEKSDFTVVLTKSGDKKIEVIKVVRDITQKGLKESKDIVDGAEASPQVIAEGVKKDAADEMKKKFEAAGAQVELK
ncbi:MAG TPA: 50S ribosomal protein L7/L12 [Candidatus Pacearchaeota archaeon]|nr:50S ribosomal protein L7/L12 [Candidatus Pacearchaeota archaeon]